MLSEQWIGLLESESLSGKGLNLEQTTFCIKQTAQERTYLLVYSVLDVRKLDEVQQAPL